jgi:hypothetical protein
MELRSYAEERETCETERNRLRESAVEAQAAEESGDMTQNGHIGRRVSRVMSP